MVDDLWSAYHGTDHSFAMAQGTLLWQPILGPNMLTQPTFVVLAFRNGYEYRNADGYINSGDDSATSCRNLTSFH